MTKKTWKKPTIFEAEIGKCRYCFKVVLTTDSFVSFLSVDENGQREKAHYLCMEKDYYKQLTNQQKKDNDKKRLSQNEIR